MLWTTRAVMLCSMCIVLLCGAVAVRTSLTRLAENRIETAGMLAVWAVVMFLTAYALYRSFKKIK